MNFHEYLSHYKNVIDSEVEGWFYPIDIIMTHGLMTDLQNGSHGDICEIGVAYGKSSISLSNFKRDSDNFYLYDIFTEEARVIAENNIKKFSKGTNLVWRLQDTTDLVFDDLLFENDIRFLHIDGCHEHPAVLNDLTLFTGRMKEYGVIAIDDYNDYEYPGVQSGVIEFILSKQNYKNWRIFAVGNNKAFMCQKKYIKDYQHGLINYIEKAKIEYTIPFEIPYGVRQVCDNNVLLCDSRENWNTNKVFDKLFDKPTIG